MKKILTDKFHIGTVFVIVIAVGILAKADLHWIPHYAWLTVGGILAGIVDVALTEWEKRSEQKA